MFNMGISSTGINNGFVNMVLQSQTNADKVINQFEKYINLGYCASAAINSAFQDTNLSEKDLTDFDKERIKRKVESVGGNYNQENWR